MINLQNYKRIDGYYRARTSVPDVAGLESGQFTTINAVTRRSGVEQNKIFAYSKVINASRLHKICKEQNIDINFAFEPFVNCIAIDSTVVGYIWDTREIVAVVDNKQLANAFSSIDFDECVVDAYNAFDNKPMLQNSRQIKAGDILKYAKDWVQPAIFLTHHVMRRSTVSATGVDYADYDIEVMVPGKGAILIGVYECWPGKNKYQLTMSHTLLKDVWPLAKKSCEKYTCLTAKKPMTYLDILYALMDGLTM